MKKQAEYGTDAYVVRHLSQLKVMVRLVEHELSAAKPGANPTLDRDMVENLLDLVEIFIEDVEEKAGAKLDREKGQKEATVARLN